MPLGGLLSFACAIIGFEYFIYFLSVVEKDLNDVGIMLKVGGVYVSQYVDQGWTGAIFIIAGCLVVIWGFREKARTRCPGHCSHVWTDSLASMWALFFLKAAITLFELAAMVYGIVLMMMAEAILVTMNAGLKACDVANEAGAVAMEVIGKNKMLSLFIGDDFEQADRLEELCDQVKESEDDAWTCFVGGIVLAAGEIGLVVYWWKYSTLALVKPYTEHSEKQGGDGGRENYKSSFDDGVCTAVEEGTSR